jgi:DNA-binding transcriptional regulator YiaG
MGIAESTLQTSLVRRLLRDGAGREIRLAARLSQVELARLAGVSTSCLNRWESGSRQPTGELAQRYFAALATLAADLDEDAS